MIVKNPIIYANIRQASEEKLKPCPFCGGKPFISICGSLNDLMYVRCRGCQAAPYGATAIYEHEKDWAACFGNVVKQWNRRIKEAHP